jgi:hypothetical protein
LRTSKSDNLIGAKNRHNKITEYREMLQKWREHGAISYAGYILGFSGDTKQSILRYLEIIKRELQTIFWSSSSSRRCPDRRTIKSSCKRVLEEPAPRFASSPVVGAEWEEAWDSFYTPEHVRTILRRSAACIS